MILNYSMIETIAVPYLHPLSSFKMDTDVQCLLVVFVCLFDSRLSRLKSWNSNWSHFIRWISKMALQPKLSVVGGVPYHVSKNWTVCRMIIKIFLWGDEQNAISKIKGFHHTTFTFLYRRLWKKLFFQLFYYRNPAETQVDSLEFLLDFCSKKVGKIIFFRVVYREM